MCGFGAVGFAVFPIRRLRLAARTGRFLDGAVASGVVGWKFPSGGAAQLLRSSYACPRQLGWSGTRGLLTVSLPAGSTVFNARIRKPLARLKGDGLSASVFEAGRDLGVVV